MNNYSLEHVSPLRWSEQSFKVWELFAQDGDALDHRRICTKRLEHICAVERAVLVGVKGKENLP